MLPILSTRVFRDIHLPSSLYLVLICTIFTLEIQCKPVEPQKSTSIISSATISTSQNQEDLIAIPSDSEYKRTSVSSHQASVTQPEYVLSSSDANDNVKQQDTNQDQQEEIYYMLPNGQTIEASQYHQLLLNNEQEKQNLEAHRIQQVDGTSYQVASDQESYPGEIVYANQNGELYRQVVNQAQNINGNGEKSVELVDLEGKSMPSGSSIMAATILTEVPVKNMPPHVLEQLKNEFGAKVIATREHPGANLVINCVDHAGINVNLCSGNRQTAEAGYVPQAAPDATIEEQPESESEHGHGHEVEPVETPTETTHEKAEVEGGAAEEPVAASPQNNCEQADQEHEQYSYSNGATPATIEEGASNDSPTIAEAKPSSEKEKNNDKDSSSP